MKFNIILILLMLLICAICFTACYGEPQEKTSITKPATESVTEFSTIGAEEAVQDTTSLVTEDSTTVEDEISCYDVVDDRLAELSSNEEFTNATRDEKAEMLLLVLEELESEGYILQDSIHKEGNGTSIVFKYINGVQGCYFLREFNSEIN